ncbi:zinc finger matrin-type protein 5 [Drosophila tropicalis]|uniref:zinc finger matrin-type protein 5 n=1 Tax=Drosophila tropicalis TaxID=46794 RepID=UPI0035AC20C9
MGGKSYFCDYCCCFMKNDINVRKLHNAGMLHTAAKVTYMRRFENPAQILKKEHLKKPCRRFFSGYCQFQLFCNYGHYSPEDIKRLEKIVGQQKKGRREKKGNKRSKKGQNRKTPPSMQPIDINKLKGFNKNLDWG